ncbi:MAG: hypothetical protein RsTaC01_0227 [Candidatus Paraimprobicoccus trichonymphae]|uniref:Uncharacterized protein n=1 Tax=Candidatus Paraimprobicoccus trichonymphae TaxID=3033793 RepID=A0AA48L1B2_9FIRM|nr:MAG: hypothetical protein RsTaC01_0227 [Candidatus Paraimprobicoccus trichonymphae]
MVDDYIELLCNIRKHIEVFGEIYNTEIKKFLNETGEVRMLLKNQNVNFGLKEKEYLELLKNKKNTSNTQGIVELFYKLKKFETILKNFMYSEIKKIEKKISYEIEFYTLGIDNGDNAVRYALLKIDEYKSLKSNNDDNKYKKFVNLLKWIKVLREKKQPYIKK